MADADTNLTTSPDPGAAATAARLEPGAPGPAAAPGGAPVAPVAPIAPIAAGAAEEIEAGIVAALKTVFDPEIPVNIYELGLIYDLNVEAGGQVQVKMTLTSPACPVAGSLPGEVKSKVESVPGVAAADVELVWDPVWNPSMMSEAARLELGMF